MSAEPVLKLAPAVEPCTIEELRAQCSILSDDFDTILLDKALDARDWIENMIGRKLISQQWEFAFDCFPPTEMRLKWAPCMSVDKIEYIPAGSEDLEYVLLDAEIYEANLRSAPAAVRVRSGKSFPSTKDCYNPVLVTATFGYGTSPDDIPPGIVGALLMATADLFRDRESSIIGLQLMEKKVGLLSKLSPYRTRCQ